MTLAQGASLLIFVAAFIVIATERVHKTHVALAGGALMLLLRLVDQHLAFHGGEVESLVNGHTVRLAVGGIDWNTIFLLIGMMIMVNITQETGVFQYAAIKSARWGGGSPIRILILLSGATALLSAFLDNVTTVLLLVPVTLLVCDALETDPVPFVCCEAIASNIGGTATLIGDPPNIIVGSAAHLTFVDFLLHLTPVILVVFAAFAVTIYVALGKRMKVTEEHRQRVMAMREDEAITDPQLLRRCGGVFAATIGGFVIHGWVGLEPATIALAGAALLLLVTKKDPIRTLERVEWPTIFLFIGLFVMVSALASQGLILKASQAVLAWSGSPAAVTHIVLWGSGCASALTGNIPTVTALVPMVHEVSGQIPSLASHPATANPLWWSLALGTCLGGNGTLLGAPANLVAAGIAGRSGHEISFRRFLKYGVPLTLQALRISWLYVILRYL